MGMVLVNEIAKRFGVTDAKTIDCTQQILQQYGLPLYPKAEIPLTQWISAIAVDKKNVSNRLNLIVLKEAGTGIVYPVSLRELEEKMR